MDSGKLHVFLNGGRRSVKGFLPLRIETASLPSAPLKPNNASAIFGGQAPYGLRAAEPSIFRPKDPTPNKQTKTRKKVSRSHSDVGISKSSEKRKSKEPVVVKRKVSESPRNGENGGVVKNGRPVSPRRDSEQNGSEVDSLDGESNGDRYPLFISVKKPSDEKPRKSSNSENQQNGGLPRRASESTLKGKSKTVENQKVAKNGGSPFNALRREKTDFIVRPRKSPSDAGNPTSSLKREKSDITLKHSKSPPGVTREKADLAKPRGSASPASLRREKSDITLKRSQPPANFTREKSDLVRPRGSASPGALRREKSDITAQRSHSPSGTVTSVKPRASASPGQLRREKSDITATRSRSPSAITREKSDLVKPRGSASPTSPKREKSDAAKKPPPSPSKSNLPKPRVSTAAVKRGETSTKDSKAASNRSSDKILQTSVSPEPPEQNTKSQIFVGEEPCKLSKQLSTETVESPEQKHCHIASIERNQVSNLRQSDIELPKQANSSSSGDKTEAIKPQNCSSPEPLSQYSVYHSNTPLTGTQTDIENSSDISHSCHAEMSKIPTPASTQVSRIPSLTKTSTPPSRIPPKSKIPSFTKTKNEEETKKSQSPTGIPTINDKPASKIPSAHRADPAKENKDPAFNEASVEEVNKQNSKISRIPSAAKSSTPAVSKIPSLMQQGSPGEKATEPDVETSKSRIPSVSSAQQNSGTPVSKIPSLTNKHSLTKTPSKEEPESKIPHLSSTPTPKTSGIPKPEVTLPGIPKPDSKPAITESRIPQLHSPATKESGILKPEVATSGIPKPETPTSPTESKIPQFSTPKSKIPAPAGSVLTRKDSEETIKRQKIEESTKNDSTPKVEEVKQTTKLEDTSKVTSSPAKVPPQPPPRQDVSQEESKANLDLSMNEDIFSEAKRMEELLRNESIVVEVPNNEDVETKKVTGKGEISKLTFEKAPDAEQLTEKSAVVTESSNNNVKETKIQEKKAEEFSFKTFGKKEDSKTVSSVTETVSTTMSLSLKESKESEKTEDVKNNVAEATSPVENKDSPAIDTLGQYEQQSRRSRSRQRKIISPDGEEASKTFEQAATEDTEKKPLDKESPPKKEDVEFKTKSSKNKGKHDKPKFVIESSLGADFYQSKSSQSKDSIAEEAKPQEVVIIQNKAFDDAKGIPKTDVKDSGKVEQATNKESAAFEDVELSSNRESKAEMRAWSMEQLDEKTVKCSCGRGGKCSIM